VVNKAMAGEPAHREMNGKCQLGAVVIPVSKATTSYSGHSEEQYYSYQWVVAVEIMLNSVNSILVVS